MKGCDEQTRRYEIHVKITEDKALIVRKPVAVPQEGERVLLNLL